MGTADMRQAVIAQYPHAAEYDDDSIIEIYYRSVVHDTDHPDFLAALARNRREVWREERERMRPRPAGPHREQQELALAGDSAAEELINACSAQNLSGCECHRVVLWLLERERLRLARQRQRYSARMRGACIECDRPLLAGDGARCGHCALQHRKQERARRERARVNREAGLCSCGREPTENGRCGRCNRRRDRQNARRREKRWTSILPHTHPHEPSVVDSTHM